MIHALPGPFQKEFCVGEYYTFKTFRCMEFPSARMGIFLLGVKTGAVQRQISPRQSVSRRVFSTEFYQL